MVRTWLGQMASFFVRVAVQRANREMPESKTLQSTWNVDRLLRPLHSLLPMYPSTASTENPVVDSMPEGTASTRCRIEEWTQRGLLLAALLTCGLCFSLSTAEPDLWGHVQYGRDLLRDGLSRTTTYSYTAVGYPWINHENLSEVVLAWTVDNLGVLGLTVGKCLWGLGIMILVLAAARRARLTFIGIAVAVLLVSANLTYFWHPRPRLFSYGLFAGLMALLTWCFSEWRSNWHLGHWSTGDAAPQLPRSRMAWLWLAPLLFIAWANAHGGFVAGLCVFTAYLAVRSLEVAWVAGRRAIPLVASWAALVAACCAATLINPYGWKLHAWLWQSLGEPRPEIVEWHGLAWGTEGSVPFLALVGLTLVGLWLSRRSLDATHTVLLALTLWQSLAHQRFAPFFAILVGLWMPIHWRSLFAKSTQTSAPTPRWMLVGCVAANLALVCLLANRLSDLKVDVSDYPTSAIHFMAEQELGGRLVVTYNWAQYAIAALGTADGGRPPVTVAFDGRFRTCYPQQIVDEHFDFVLGTGPHVPRHRGVDSTPPDRSRALVTGTPDLVLVSRKQEPSVHVMQQNRDAWTLLYQDSVAQLWGRRSVYDDPHHPNYLPPSARRTAPRVQTGMVGWPALPGRVIERRTWVNGRFRPTPPAATHQETTSIGRQGTDRFVDLFRLRTAMDLGNGIG